MDERKVLLAALASGDEALMEFGKNGLASLAATARKKQGRMNLGNGVIYDPETGESYQDPNYDAAEVAKNKRTMDRDAAKETARSGRPSFQAVPTEGGVEILQTNPNAPSGAGSRQHILVAQPIAATDRQKAAEQQRLAREAMELSDSLKTTASVNPWVDIPADFVRQHDTTRSLAPTIERIGYTPEELKVRNRGNSLESDIIRAMSGLAVTGYELANVTKWSPFAPGITESESQDRLDTIRNILQGRADAILGANDAEPSEPTPRSRGATGRWDEVKTLGGKQYVRKGNTWYEQD